MKHCIILHNQPIVRHLVFTVKHYVLSIICIAAVLCSCQETLEERGQREASDYTRKHCPTPVGEGITLDSMTFDAPSHTFSYCYTLSGVLDDSAAIWQDDPRALLLQQVKNSTHLRLYKEAGYSFRYVYYSTKHPGLSLFDNTFKAADYQ